MPPRASTPVELRDQLLALGVEPGSVLVVHTAFSKVLPVVGGPLGLIEGLRLALSSEGTLVMPSMSDDEPASPGDASPRSGELVTRIPKAMARLLLESCSCRLSHARAD
jgi:aminoglycoside N3'-acetyltransferase